MGQSRDQHRPLLGIEGGKGRGQAEAGEELALYTVQVQYYRTRLPTPIMPYVI